MARSTTTSAASAKRYAGFVSYSHAADGNFAPTLQNGLQRLAKPWRQRRALEIFRDDTGLSVNPNLWTSIATALDNSRYFILLASPDAAQSPWVGKEIQHWIATHGTDTILPVLTDGTWTWDPTHNNFAWDQPHLVTAVHPALHNVFPSEPRHLDMSWAKTETQLTLRNPRFRDQIAQIAAPLHGISKDDLESEDIRQQRRTQRTQRGAITTLTLLTITALIATLIAITSQHEATTQRDRAEEQRIVAEREDRQATAQLLAAESVAVPAGEGDLALLLAVRSTSVDTTSEAADALRRLVALDAVVYLHGAPDGTSDAAITADATAVAAAGYDGSVHVWDVATGAHRFDPIPGNAAAVSWSSDGSRLLVADVEDLARVYDGRSGALIGSPISTGHLPAIRWVGSTQREAVAADLSPDGTTFAIGNPVTRSIDVWSVEGERRWSTSAYDPNEEYPVYQDGAWTFLDFLPDGTLRIDDETASPGPDPTTVMITRPEGVPCGSHSGMSGPKTYVPELQRHFVVEDENLVEVDHRPWQGPADRAVLPCWTPQLDDAAVRTLAITLAGASSNVASSADGTTVVSGISRSLVVVKAGAGAGAADLTVSQLVERACAIANRELDADEWARRFPGLDWAPTCPDSPTVQVAATTAADPAAGPSSSDLRRVAGRTGIIYLGPCDRLAPEPPDTQQQILCGDVLGHRGDEALVDVRDAYSQHGVLYHLRIVDGTWSAESTYDPNTAGPDEPSPDWVDRLRGAK